MKGNGNSTVLCNNQNKEFLLNLDMLHKDKKVNIFQAQDDQNNEESA